MRLTLPRLRILERRPGVARAVRAGLAAAIAWLIVRPLGGAANLYPYYAPFGAVIAVTTTVAGSIRDSLRAVAAVMIGAALALAIHAVTDNDVLGLLVVIGGGSLIANWSVLGRLGSWVPVAGLFVLIPGGADSEEFLIGYLGLTSLGAAIGIVVNLVFAPLPLSRTGLRVREVRDALAEQLTELAEGLRGDRAPTPEEWQEGHRALIPLSRRMSEMVGEASEARRANWRARHWRDTANRQYALARALEQLTFLVEDVSTLLSTHEVSGSEHIALGPRLRPQAAELLAAAADLLAGLDSPIAPLEPLRRVDAAMAELVEEIRRTRGETGDDLFTAGALVIAVRRAVSALVPDDHADELPSRH
ncbi:FUSC family protein [Nocardioides terrisoli]|uniref:FUSC family protein n=1 Tax=Nocardioides terrisoli TaxID=3388267 RepID=UPI00287BB487|nr:hypothetical protein [Nocardioides marmorisolisilvae]